MHEIERPTFSDLKEVAPVTFQYLQDILYTEDQERFLLWLFDFYNNDNNGGTVFSNRKTALTETILRELMAWLMALKSKGENSFFTFQNGFILSGKFGGPVEFIFQLSWPIFSISSLQLIQEIGQIQKFLSK